MENKLKDRFFKLLKKDGRLWDKEGKELNQTLLKDLIDRLDANLLALFLADKEIKEKYFIKVGDVFVLKQSELKFFIDENKLDNSYTRYQNKIGLRAGDRLLGERGEVVLDWPFKDCVLEGGMAKEDQKRDEIFFNQILAKDEIDRLFDPKAFAGWTRHTAKGAEKVKELKRGQDGVIRENLIIKGNNLLALHSLKQQFAGKIKLIYIDPPYNTGSDSFGYNDNFNHSAWLTFMKNRLEIAKELLSENGTMIVQIDDNQLALLKILMDEIFNTNITKNKQNFVQYVEVRSNVGAANEYQNPFMPKNCEYLLIYAKNYNERIYKPIWVKSSVDLSYSKIILNPEEINYKKWKVVNIKNEFEKKYDVSDWKNENIVYEFFFENANRIFQSIGPKGPGAGLLAAMEESKKNNGWSLYKRETAPIYCYKGRMVRFYSKNIRQDENGNKSIVRELGSLWTDILWNGISNEGGVTLIGGKKPEKLLRRIIQMSTEPEEIILDYHLGSGTTAAVAHKMGRQYIGIEQLDYGENDSVVRLDNVIKGDQSGISKAVGWKGGGEFVYCEMAKLNERAKEMILAAKSLAELEKLFGDLYERYFLNYNVEVKNLRWKILTIPATFR